MSPFPLTLRPESLQRVPPPGDSGASAVPAELDGRGAGQSWAFQRAPNPAGFFYAPCTSAAAPAPSLPAARSPQVQLQAAETGI